MLARDVAATLLLPFRTYKAAKRERHFPTSPSSHASWRHLTIAAADVERIKARCKPLGASVNDALIAALARVAAGRSTRGPLAVMYTMDLRRYAGSPRLTPGGCTLMIDLLPPQRAGLHERRPRRSGLAAFGHDIEDLYVIGPNIANVTVPAVVAFGYRGGVHLELFGCAGIAPEALEQLEAELREALELP